MFLLDDLLVRPFVSVLTVIQALAIEEQYDRTEIRNEIKENRLLFEIGDRSRTEYERRQQKLRTQLDIAEQAHDSLSNKVTVKK